MRRGAPEGGGDMKAVGWTNEEWSEIQIDRLAGRIDRIKDLVEEGGKIDGAHHKQFYLAQIAAEVGIILPDQGIAP